MCKYFVWLELNKCFFTCHDGSQFANLSKSKDQNLWRNNTQNSTFLTSKAWPHLTCHPAQPGEFMALASLAAITAFSVSKGSCSSSASTGILLARRPSSLSVFRKRKYLSVSFYEGWRLHVQIWVEVFWGFHLTLFLAFQQIHSSTSQCSFAKKRPEWTRRRTPYLVPYGMKHAQQYTVIYSHTQYFIATHLDFLRLPPDLEYAIDSERGRFHSSTIHLGYLSCRWRAMAGTSDLERSNF